MQVRKTAATGEKAKAEAALWGGLAHDLRQPVQSLLLLVHLLSQKQDVAAKKATIQYMQQGLVTLQDMIEAIGQLSRLECNSRQTPVAAIEFGPVLGIVEMELARVLAGRHIGLEVGGTGTLIEGEPVLLVLLVKGLVCNAIASCSAGAIALEAQSSNSSTSIACTYEGDPPDAHQRKSFFIELASKPGEPPVAGVIPGFAFIERLSAALGWTVTIGASGKGLCRLSLTHTKAA